MPSAPLSCKKSTTPYLLTLFSSSKGGEKYIEDKLLNTYCFPEWLPSILTITMHKKLTDSFWTIVTDHMYQNGSLRPAHSLKVTVNHFKYFKLNKSLDFKWAFIIQEVVRAEFGREGWKTKIEVGFPLPLGIFDCYFPKSQSYFMGMIHNFE